MRGSFLSRTMFELDAFATCPAEPKGREGKGKLTDGSERKGPWALPDPSDTCATLPAGNRVASRCVVGLSYTLFRDFFRCFLFSSLWDVPSAGRAGQVRRTFVLFLGLLNLAVWPSSIGRNILKLLSSCGSTCPRLVAWSTGTSQVSSPGTDVDTLLECDSGGC